MFCNTRIHLIEIFHKKLFFIGIHNLDGIKLTYVIWQEEGEGGDSQNYQHFDQEHYRLGLFLNSTHAHAIKIPKSWTNVLTFYNFHGKNKPVCMVGMSTIGESGPILTFADCKWHSEC